MVQQKYFRDSSNNGGYFKHRNGRLIESLYMTALLVCIALLFSCAQPPARPDPRTLKKQPQPKVGASSLEKRIHALINKERQKQGLSQLEWSNELAAVGRMHSHDMAKRNYFDHYSPEGHDFTYRYLQGGYSCAVRIGHTIYTGAENLALNNLYDSVTTVNKETFYDWNSPEKIAETTVQGWMNSPGHRKNILTPHWGHEGIGVVIAPNDRVYVTQNFC
jgi:uncharacterized protein YkwD